MSLPENVIVIANSDEELESNLIGANLLDINVVGTDVWKGIVPPNSFCEIAPGIRMSTPEYLAFRKANQLDHDAAVIVMCELLTTYTTNVINPTYSEYKITKTNSPHTTVEDMVNYLSHVMDTEAGMKALEILRDALRFVDAYEALCEIAYKSFGTKE